MNIKIYYDNLTNKNNENLSNIRNQSKKINELMQKNSDLEILVTELKNENKNYSIDKKDMFDELTEYKKKEIIIKNSYQDNFTNLLDNLEKINSKFDKNNFKELSNIMKFKTVSSIPDFIKMN